MPRKHLPSMSLNAKDNGNNTYTTNFRLPMHGATADQSEQLSAQIAQGLNAQLDFAKSEMRVLMLTHKQRASLKHRDLMYARLKAGMEAARRRLDSLGLPIDTIDELLADCERGEQDAAK